MFLAPFAKSSWISPTLYFLRRSVQNDFFMVYCTTPGQALHQATLFLFEFLQIFSSGKHVSIRIIGKRGIVTHATRRDIQQPIAKIRTETTTTSLLLL
jgi:hypothetical protein